MFARAAGLAVLLLLVASCLWRGYARVLTIHVEVLTSMADKIAWQADIGRQPTPNDVTELLYPLERARRFRERYRGDDAPRSLALFSVLLDRYDAFAERVDRTRADASAWRHARASLLHRDAKLHRIAKLVLAQLAREGG